MTKTKKESKPKKLATQQLVALVDKAGHVEAQAKANAEEFKGIKDQLLAHAMATGYDGGPLVLEGSVHKATVAHTAEFPEGLPSMVQAAVEAEDRDLAAKLFPVDLVVAGYDFTGDEEAVKALKKDIPAALFKKLFARRKGSTEQNPSISAIRAFLGKDTKDESKNRVKQLFTDFTEWLPKRVSITKLS